MKNVENITSIFNNSNFNWMPHTFFFCLLIIVFLIGLAMGRKTTIFFGIGMISATILALILSLAATNFIFNNFVPNSIKIGNTTLRELLSGNKTYIDSILFLPLLLITISVILIIQFIFFICFRKRFFKKKIYELKNTGNSTFTYRLYGSLFAILFSLPILISFSSYFAIFGDDENTGLIYSKSLKIISLGKMSNSTEEVRDLLKIANSVAILVDKGDAIASLFGDPNGNHKAIEELLSDEKGREAVKTIFESNFVNKNVEVVAEQLTKAQIESIKLDTPKPDIDWMPELPKDMAIDIPRDSFDNFTNSLIDDLRKSGAKISKEGLEYLLTQKHILNIT